MEVIKEFLTSIDLQNIFMILVAGGATGLYVAIKKAIKEIKDVKTKYIKYKKDGFTAKEKDDLIDEMGEALKAIDGVWNIFKGLFKKKAK